MASYPDTVYGMLEHLQSGRASLIDGRERGAIYSVLRRAVAERDALEAEVERLREALERESGVNWIRLERERQKRKWPESHDDEHDGGELAGVAAMLAASVADEEAGKIGVVVHVDTIPHPEDPWGLIAKHKHPRKRLMIAGALIAADLDRRAREARKALEGDA